MKKERIFYLDFIRAFATFIIVLTHYNAMFMPLYGVDNPKGVIVTTSVGNIYIGAFGVSLFLIISGAALMLSYGEKEKFDYKRFFGKRFLTIYPCFWIAYFLVFLYNFYEAQTIPQLPKKNIIFSVLGIDGYLSCFGVKVFYFVGEWFLGFIILVYLIFPFIQWLMKKQPVVLAVLVFALYVLTLVFLKDKPYTNLLITTRLPEILFGMYFMKYIKKVPWYVALVSLAVIVANSVFKPQFIDGNIQVTYIGICSFLVLVFVSKFLQFEFVKNVCSVVCKYSYPCFIIHHYLICKMAAKFDLLHIGTFYSCLLFLACLVAVAVASFLLQTVTDTVMKLFESKKERSETAK